MPSSVTRVTRICSLWLLAIVAVFAAGYVFVIFRFDAVANAIIFPGARYEKLAIGPEARSYGAYSVSLPLAGSGRSVSALVLPDGAHPDRVILYAHGNGERLSHIQDALVTLRKMGATVVAYDYPGYGESTGTANAVDMKDAIGAALAFIHDKLGVPKGKIIYGGYSLGTAAAMLATTIETPAKVFLIAPFSSDKDLGPFYTGADIYAWCGHEAYFPSADYARALNVPVFVAHGTADTVVPHSSGRKLFDALASNDKTFLDIPGASHWISVSHPAIRDALARFLSTER